MKLTLAGVFMTLSVLAFVVYSQSPETDSLAFTMTPIKERVLLLEPIPLRFSVENRTDTPLPLYGPITIQSIKLAIEKPDGHVVVPDQLSYINSHTRAAKGDVPAGAKHESKEVLAFQLSKYFDQVGQYRLKATFQNGDSTLSTVWVVITVEQPTGSDASAYEYLRKGSEPSIVHFARNSEQEAFLELFPESPYSDYLRYSLATSYAEKEPVKAIELYKRLQAKQDFVYADEVDRGLKHLEHQQAIRARRRKATN